MTNVAETSAPPPSLEVEMAGLRNSGKCACCGGARRTVWGYVYRDGGPRACYFVEWTLGRSICQARFDVVIGDWNDGTTEDDRAAVAMQFAVEDGEPSFSIVDAAGRPAAEVGRATERVDVVGTPLADEAMTIAGAVLEADERVRELGATFVRS